MEPDSFLNYDVSDAQEPDLYPQGVISVTIAEAEVVDTKDGGSKRLALKFDVPEYQGNYWPLRDGINLPVGLSKGIPLTADELNRRKLGLRRFYECFLGAPSYNGPTSELIGRQGKVQLGIRPPQGDFPASNSVKYLPQTGS